MVERRVVKLKLSPEEMQLYVPPHGVDVIWLEYKPSRNEAVAEFVTSDAQPDPLLRKSAKDIRHELGTYWRNRLLEDNISHHLSPRRAMRVEGLLNHPLLENAPREVKRMVDAATDVHEVKLTKEQADAMATGKRGAKAEPKEVRTEHRRSENLGEYDVETYVYEMGQIDSG